MPTSRPRGLAPTAGMSLVEIMVALTILALAASLVPVALGGRDREAEMRAATRQLVGALRATRAEAMAGFQPRALHIDLKAKALGAPDGDQRPLPASLDYRLLVPEAQRTETGATVLFFPDGSSTGATVTARRDGWSRSVEVMWLTGRVQATDRVEAVR